MTRTAPRSLTIPVLFAALSGLRSLTPLALAATAVRRGRLPHDSGAPRWLGSRPVAAGAVVLAAAEIYGDKLRWAPNRTVLPGMVPRLVNAALAARALTPRARAGRAGWLGAAAAAAVSYPSVRARLRAMQRHGQIRTGLAEDALTIGAALLLLRQVTKTARS